jgi:predicted nuclease with TOPRIM domain
MTKQDKSYSGMIGEVARLTTALAANAADLPHLEGVRGRLEKILAETQEMAKQQAALVASKQEASKKLKALVNEGQRVATGVAKLLKEHYGLKSEKLAEFGMQPFRGRKTKKAPQEDPGTPPPPTVHPTNPNL